jgi:hypothetical protein
MVVNGISRSAGMDREPVSGLGAGKPERNTRQQQGGKYGRLDVHVRNSWFVGT